MLDIILEKVLEVAGELVVEGVASAADVVLDAASSVADKAVDVAGGAVDFVADVAKEKAEDMAAEAAIGALGAAAGFVSPSTGCNDDKKSQEERQENVLELQMINQLTNFCDAEIGIGRIGLEKVYEHDEVMRTFQALGKIQAEIICNHFRAYRCFMPDREDNSYCSVSINDLTENLDLAFQGLNPESISWVMLEFGAFGAEGLFAYCADVENKVDEGKTIKTQAFLMMRVLCLILEAYWLQILTMMKDITTFMLHYMMRIIYILMSIVNSVLNLINNRILKKKYGVGF